MLAWLQSLRKKCVGWRPSRFFFFLLNDNSSKSLTRRRIGVRWAIVAVAGYLLFAAARLFLLVQRSQSLARQSDRFNRDYHVGNPADEPVTFVVMGDSTAVGYGVERLEQSCAFQVAQAWATSGKYVHVVNIAVTGARLRDVVNAQLPQVSKWRPELVTVCVGANDATHGTSAAQYRALLPQLLSGLKATGAKVLFANTPDMYRAPALPLPLAALAGRRALRQNALLIEAAGHAGVEVVDLFGRGRLDYSLNHGLYAPDMFHPAAPGYGVWAKIFTEELKPPLLPRP